MYCFCLLIQKLSDILSSKNKMMLADIGICNMAGIAPTHLEAKQFGMKYNKKLFGLSAMRAKQLDLKAHALYVRNFPFLKSDGPHKYIDSKEYLESLRGIVIGMDAFSSVIKKICKNFEFKAYISDVTNKKLISFEGHKVLGMFPLYISVTFSNTSK